MADEIVRIKDIPTYRVFVGADDRIPVDSPTLGTAFLDITALRISVLQILAMASSTNGGLESAADKAFFDMIKEVAFNTSGQVIPSGMAQQLKVVQSALSPTPDYIGQPGRDTAGNFYIGTYIPGPGGPGPTSLWTLISPSLIYRDSSGHLLAPGIANQTGTVTDSSHPTPSYAGQQGRDSYGNNYVAVISGSTLIWEKFFGGHKIGPDKIGRASCRERV